jgi:hypothetical protein
MYYLFKGIASTLFKFNMVSPTYPGDPTIYSTATYKGNVSIY